MTHFQQYTVSNDAVISKAAHLLEETTTQYTNHQLSKTEYDELCADILNFQQVHANIQDMNRVQAIINAFNAMLSIVSIVKSII